MCPPIITTHGITNALDGTDDGDLGSQVAHLWIELEMPERRDQLLLDVDQAVANGDISSFSQYQSFLLSYDEHEPLPEGYNAAAVYVYDESGAHAPMGANDEFDLNMDEQQSDSEVPPMPHEADAFVGECSAPLVGECSAPLVAGSDDVSLMAHLFDVHPETGDHGVQPETVGLQPETVGLQPEDGKQLQAIKAMMNASKSLRSAGEETLAEYLLDTSQRRLRSANKLDAHKINILREVTDGKRKLVQEARSEDTQKRYKIAEQKAELAIAKEKTKAAAADAKKTHALAKSTEIEHKAARLAASEASKANLKDAKAVELEKKASAGKAKADARAEVQRVEKLRILFPARLAASFSKFFSSKTHGEHRRAALLKHIATLKGKVPWKKIKQVPAFWNPAEKKGLMCISKKDTGGAYPDVKPIYGTEAFRWEMNQLKCGTVPATTQLRKYIAHVLPGLGILISWTCLRNHKITQCMIMHFKYLIVRAKGRQLS